MGRVCSSSPPTGNSPSAASGSCRSSAPGLRFRFPVSGGSGNLLASQNAHRRRRQAEPLGSPLPEAPKARASQLRPEAVQGAAGTRAPGAGHTPRAPPPPAVPGRQGHSVRSHALRLTAGPARARSALSSSRKWGQGGQRGPRRSGAASRLRGRGPGSAGVSMWPPRGECGGGGGGAGRTAPLLAGPPRPALPAAAPPGGRAASRRERATLAPRRGRPDPRPRWATLRGAPALRAGVLSLGRRAVSGSAPGAEGLRLGVAGGGRPAGAARAQAPRPPPTPASEASGTACSAALSLARVWRLSLELGPPGLPPAVALETVTLPAGFGHVGSVSLAERTAALQGPWR